MFDKNIQHASYEIYIKDETVNINQKKGGKPVYLNENSNIEWLAAYTIAENTNQTFNYTIYDILFHEMPFFNEYAS